jgi:hypothetical protein
MKLVGRSIAESEITGFTISLSVLIAENSSTEELFCEGRSGEISKEMGEKKEK